MSAHDEFSRLPSPSDKCNNKHFVKLKVFLYKRSSHPLVCVCVCAKMFFLLENVLSFRK